MFLRQWGSNRERGGEHNVPGTAWPSQGRVGASWHGVAEPGEGAASWHGVAEPGEGSAASIRLLLLGIRATVATDARCVPTINKNIVNFVDFLVFF